MYTALDQLISVEDFRSSARRRLPKAVFEFIDGGAEDEVTLYRNRQAFKDRFIVPRILTNVSEPDTSTQILNHSFPAPLVVCPMGSASLVAPGTDLNIARAAADLGIPYTLSTMSTTSMQAVADEIDGHLWFQLYVLRDHAFNKKLIMRAAEFDYSALVVTVDLQAGGKREKDLRNAISMPLRPTPRLMLDALTHPRWTVQQVTGGLPQFENVSGYLEDTGAGMTIAARVGQNLDAAFDWDHLKELRDLWAGPMIVKGLMHPEDADELPGIGIDALWLSNHGGRQLDGAAASLDILEVVAQQLQGRLDLIVDSGIQRGSDLLKARALGASMCGIGRAALFGAVHGQAGVEKVFDILIEELKLSMKLAGQPTYTEISDSLLFSTLTA